MTKSAAPYLFLCLLALYLLTYAPTFHSSDGQAMFATAESLVRWGRWDIEQIRWMGLQQGTYGLDGLLYSRKGLGQPLLALPLTWLGLFVPGWGPATATILFGSLITALSGVFIYLILRRLDYGERTSLLAALIYGTGTLAWPYAKTFFSDPLAGFLLLATLFAFILFAQTRHNRYLFLAGLSLAWAVATRYAEGIFLPVFGLLLLAYLHRLSPLTRQNLRQPQPLQSHLAAILAFCAPIAVVGLGLMLFNFLRYGNPLNTGYLPEETFSAIWWQGIAGQLISPGRGLLLYSPILVLSFFGLRSFWHRDRFVFIAIGAVILIHLLLYGKWFMWHGGFAWGPRFMVPTLPFWALLLAPIIDKLPPRSWWQRLFYALWALSVIVQIPGLAVDFDLWQNQLLETGLPLFAPVTFFAPVYSPLLATWQFIRIDNLDLAWVNQGQIVWGLLLLLLINGAIALWALLSHMTDPESSKQPRLTLAASVAIMTVGFLLHTVHRHQPQPLQEAFAQINQTEIALIYNNPEAAASVAELSEAPAAMLGLAAPDAEHLDAFTSATNAVWWLSDSQSDIENHLKAAYGIASQAQYGTQRLVLFARADGPVQEINVPFEEPIVLQSVRLSERLQNNQPLAVALNWQASRTPTHSYAVFVHLLDPNGQTVAQADGQPVHWSRPTNTWQPQETIIDLHALGPADLQVGTYTLIGGLYQADTGERLPTAAGQEAVQLGTFEVSIP